jgi:methylmalonyl-CoA mutase N-terminal domain/subunit
MDPLAGSYFVERLTSDMEAGAADYIRRIDEMGGIVGAIERGFPQKEIADAAYTYQMQIDGGEKTIVGVNAYVQEETRRPEILRIDPGVEGDQIARLRRTRAERDAPRHSKAISELARTAAGKGNLVPHIIEAVRAHASVGEICGVLKPVFGEYREKSVL